jgi:hypothetical protein
MTHNNNTLTFDNHDTYIYYIDEFLKNNQDVILIPTNQEDIDTVFYASSEANLYTNGIKNGIIKFNDFIRGESLNLNISIGKIISTIITSDGILMFNYALEKKIFTTSGAPTKTLATYKSGKYANYINVEIQIDREDTYRILTISY